MLFRSVARIGYLLRPLGRAANTIRRCGEHGVAVTRASAARIVGNTIEGNGGSGVFVSRLSQADIFGNSISGNGANGGNAAFLYFTAGIPGSGSVEDHGLFGSIRPAQLEEANDDQQSSNDDSQGDSQGDAHSNFHANSAARGDDGRK